MEPLPNPAAISGIGIIPALTHALCASNIDWVSSESPAGSPPYGPSSEMGITIFVALGFHLWSSIVGGLPGTFPRLSCQEKQAQVEAGPQNSL